MDEKYVKLNEVLELISGLEINNVNFTILKEKIKNLNTIPIKENDYLVREFALKNMLSDSYKLCALENGGVDNWIGYSDSLNDYLKSVAPDKYITFEDIATTSMKLLFTKVGENNE